MKRNSNKCSSWFQGQKLQAHSSLWHAERRVLIVRGGNGVAPPPKRADWALAKRDRAAPGGHVLGSHGPRESRRNIDCFGGVEFFVSV
jgi:hypothetical protein